MRKKLPFSNTAGLPSGKGVASLSLPFLTLSSFTDATVDPSETGVHEEKGKGA